MLALRLLFAVLVAASVARAVDECVFYDKDATLFVSTPAPVDLSTSCPLFSSSSCCTSTYGSDVASASDDLSSALLGALVNPTAGCVAAAKQLACLGCSPGQSAWASYGYDVSSVRVCATFAQSLYAACKDAELEAFGALISEVYADAADLLLHFWQPNYVLSVVDVSPCYDPALRPCTSADYSFVYTQCDNTNHRSLVWFLRPGAVCEGGASAPAPVNNLQCGVACRAGSYLPPGTNSCANCSAGSYNIGGGVLVDYWDRWPTELITHLECKPSKTASWAPCNWGWKLMNATLRSAPINNSQAVAFVLPLVLERTGYVRFAVYVDAERGYDGLRFKIDDTQVLFTSSTDGFFSFQQPLTMGFHTLRWEYIKDDSLAMGLDAAVLRSIEISGTSFAAPSCSLCAPGTYSSVAAIHCIDCPAGTAAGADGSAECGVCSSKEYSFQGSASCIPRPACTQADWVSLPGPCVNNQQTPTFSLLQPIICDMTNGASYQPPVPTPTSCPPCPPGTLRTSGTCTPCPPGQRLQGSACVPCLDGQYSDSVLAWAAGTWNSWSGMRTSCTGECSTAGWRLRSNSIDSGVGHGHDTNVQLVFDFETFGSQLSADLSVGFVAARPGGLWLTAEFDKGTNSDSAVSITAFPSGALDGHLVQLKLDAPLASAGHHNLTITAHLAPVGDPDRTARVVIQSLSIHGVTGGGATQCLDCPAGAMAIGSVAMCSVCSPGTFSSTVRSTSCTPCSANTHAPFSGMTSCEPCGVNTITPPGSATCVESCRYSPVPAVSYDLSPLRRTDEMYGPVYDSRNNLYFFNPCSTRHTNHTCLTDDGAPIPSYVCQTTFVGVGEDLGHIMGYYPLSSPHSVADGLILTYTGGNKCAAHSPDGLPVERATNITFLCDPAAGLGAPALPPGGPTAVEAPTCKYHFEWRSAYACPLCTAANYEAIPLACDLRGNQQVIYQWLQPKRCVGGVSLPAATVQVCVDANVTCPAGQYADTLSTCQNASVGTYTTGPDVYLGSSDAALTTRCADGGAACWLAQARYPSTLFGSAPAAHSSDAAPPPVLMLALNFRSAGVLRFDYRFFGDYSATSLVLQSPEWPGKPKVLLPLAFVSPVASPFSFRTMSIDFPAGPTTVSFYVNRTSGTVGSGGAVVTSIFATNQRLAANGETPCPNGYIAPAEGATGCLPCPADTYSSPSHAECVACPAGTYSPARSESPLSCLPLLDCTADDYVLTTGPCINNEANASLRLALGVRCAVNNESYVPPPPSTVACLSCPIGLQVNDNGLCELACGSSEGTTYFDVETGECLPLPAGHVVTRTLSYASPRFTSLPPSWLWGCSGSGCISASGWRMEAGQLLLEPFFGAGRTDAFFTFQSVLMAPGSLSFNYAGTLMLFVNNKRMPIPPPPAILPLPAGPVSVLFLFSFSPLGQQSGGISSATDLFVSDIVVTQTTVGADLAPTMCPAGTVPALGPAGVAVCQPCPIGSVAALPGSVTCSPCAPTGYANQPGSTSCTACGDYSSSEATPMLPEAGTGCHLSDGCILVVPELNGTGPSFNTSLLPTVLDLSSFADVLGHREPLLLRMDACNGGLECAGTGPHRSCVLNTATGEQSFATNALMVLLRDFASWPVNPSRQALYRLDFVGTPTAECPEGQQIAVTTACNLLPAATPTITDLVATTCAIELTLLARGGCPMCRFPEDYLIVQSACADDGTIEMRWVSNGNCLASPLAEAKMNATSWLVPCPSTTKPPHDNGGGGGGSPNLLGLVALVVLILCPCVILAAAGYFAYQHRDYLLERFHELKDRAQSASSSSHRADLEMHDLDTDELANPSLRSAPFSADG